MTALVATVTAATDTGHTAFMLVATALVLAMFTTFMLVRFASTEEAVGL